jgi:hypothetical protein
MLKSPFSCSCTRISKCFGPEKNLLTRAPPLPSPPPPPPPPPNLGRLKEFRLLRRQQCYSVQNRFGEERQQQI